jgi:plastocyanin
MQRWKMQQCKAVRIFTGIFGAAVVLSLMLTTGALRPRSVSAAQLPPSRNVVAIDNFSFTPTGLTILAGTQITWINEDDVPHTVVSVDHKFKSQALDTGEKFTFMFQTPGTYEYFCSVHPKMIGKIIVK